MIYSHLAFSDDSEHEDGRYNSLGLVTLSYSKYLELEVELNELFLSSGIKNEFKWTKVATAKYRFVAEKINRFIFNHINDLRIDVLIWDMQDSRRKGIVGRDNDADLGIMYYQLLSCTLTKRWDIKSNTWLWKPDKQSSIGWETMKECLVSKKYKNFIDLFDINRENFFRLNLGKIEPSDSQKERFIQIADYFAGLGAYSYGHFIKYKKWLKLVSPQISLFCDNMDDLCLSNREKIRFPLLGSFIKDCKKFGLGISLEQTQGLKTYNPQKNINFWLYQPQRFSDKAPTKK